MLMTGKGGVKVDRYEAYKTFDRACRAGHGGACYLQAQILSSPKGKLHPSIPYDPKRATDLYDHVCNDHNDSVSCFTLASTLLRGDLINDDADNVSPQEAKGESPIIQRENEKDRRRRKENGSSSKGIPRDPKRAEQLLLKACIQGGHVTSCHNLAVMYENGDDGVPKDPKKAKQFQTK